MPAPGGIIQTVEPGSLAEALGLQPGDGVLSVNARPVADVIDVQFYAAEPFVSVEFRRRQTVCRAAAPRSAGQRLGLTFVHPTFDTPIRRCNNLCPFCFVLQMAPHLRRPLYVKDDDYRYSFLYGHYVTLTNLSAADWRRIETQHLTPLYLSVHATDLKARRACLGNPRAPAVLKQLRWFKTRGLQVHTQLVITPGLNDGAVLEQSLRDLARFYPTVVSVSLVPVGLTRYHRHGRRLNTLAEAERVLALADKWQTRLLKRWGVRWVYPTDEWFVLTHRAFPPHRAYAGLHLQENGVGLVRDFLDDWRRLQRRLKNRSEPVGRYRKITLVTGQAFAGVLRRTAAAFNRRLNTEWAVADIVNARFGPSVTVAGLLTGADVVAQLQGRDLGAAVVLPRVMFAHPQIISLDDISPRQMAAQLNRPVLLADTLSEVWASLGAGAGWVEP